MYTFDASSVLHAWDNYPIKQFPPMWNWIAAQIENGAFSISRVALDEVAKKSPECGTWLKVHEIEILPLSNEVLQEANAIKQILEITEDNYHPKGVGENDLFIIAIARVSGKRLVSDEGRQSNLPKSKRQYKIPAVCELTQVGVSCIQFIELIKESDAVFG